MPLVPPLNRNLSMSDHAHSETERLLREARLYSTACRRATLSVLLGSDRPLSQAQIADRLRDRGFNKVSIYRTLASLVEVGLVHKAFLHKRTWHFEAAHRCSQTQCHPHFTCTRCGATFCMTEVRMPMAQGQPRGFVILRQQVRLEGYCPGCAG